MFNNFSSFFLSKRDRLADRHTDRRTDYTKLIAAFTLSGAAENMVQKVHSLIMLFSLITMDIVRQVFVLLVHTLQSLGQSFRS